jgi:hypothetical protein
MKTEPPPHRRKFADARDEMEYLYYKLLYWLYQRADATRARPYADRLQRLLRKADAKQESIFGQECRSLVSETKGDRAEAIAHGVKEISLIRRLHEISEDSPGKDLVFKHYGYNDLSDRLDLLARLYHQDGHLDRAIAILKDSKQMCVERGIPFDGDDMLQEYQDERKAMANGPPPAVGRKR